MVHHGVVIDGYGQPHQQQPGGDVDDLLPPGVLPDGAAGGAVDLQYTHSTDDQGDDEQGPVEIAGAEVAGHGSLVEAATVRFDAAALKRRAGEGLRFLASERRVEVCRFDYRRFELGSSDWADRAGRSASGG